MPHHPLQRIPWGRPAPTPPNERLCDKCQPWQANIGKWQWNEDRWPGGRPTGIQLENTRNVDYGNLREVASRQQCMLCSTIALMIRDQWGLKRDEEEPWTSDMRIYVHHWAFGTTTWERNNESDDVTGLCSSDDEDEVTSERGDGSEDGRQDYRPWYLASRSDDSSDDASDDASDDTSESYYDGELRTICYFWMRPDKNTPKIPKEFVLSIAFICEAETRVILRIEEWQTTYTDISRWKSLLWRCEKSHSCCRSEHGGNDSSRAIEVSYLVDVERRCVVPAEKGFRYVALSYRWIRPPPGSVHQQLETGTLEIFQRDGAITGNHFRKSILDAMSLCSLLEEKYLWVDQLCIVQNDESQKVGQIQIMDKIYGSAALTIVVAAGATEDIGIPGLPGRPRQPWRYNHTRVFKKPYHLGANFHMIVDKSIWNTRGWTFQERLLSRRILYFTEFQAYYTCQNHLVEEECNRTKYSGSWEQDINMGDNPLQLQNCGNTYNRIVFDYTRRTLTYQSDILNAFAGVRSRICDKWQTEILFGLPEFFLPQALTWMGGGDLKRRTECLDIPSWSWAAWLGPVEYDVISPTCGWNPDHYGTLVQFHVQESAKVLRPIEALSSWFGINGEDEENQFCFFLQEKYLCKVHTFPEMLEHQDLDLEACQVAAELPGCLVFNTTSATLSVRRRKLKRDLNRKTTSFLIWTEQGAVGSVWLDQDDTGNHLCNISTMRVEFILLSAGMSWTENWAQPHLNRKGDYIKVDGNKEEPHACTGIEDYEEDDYDIDATEYTTDTSNLAHLFNIMAIERTGQVARRCGIGKISTKGWEEAGPRWETIVLM